MNLLLSVFPLRSYHQGQSKAHGTIWCVDAGLYLTAAHCLRDPMDDSPCDGPFQVQLPQGEVPAEVVRTHPALDAALLRLALPAGSAPPPALPIGVLPAPGQFPAGLPWSSYGYALANPTGLHLSGTVTSPSGNVAGQPALQLFCQEGGLGQLHGASGAPVCVAGQAVGLIRYAPPGAQQPVIHATALKDLVAAGFSELAGLLRQAQPTHYTRLVLLVTLCKLIPARFEKVFFLLDLNQAEFLPLHRPVSERAGELINHFWNLGEPGQEQLVAVIQQVDRQLLAYVAGTT